MKNEINGHNHKSITIIGVQSCKHTLDGSEKP